jgi:L-fuconolactonase
VTPAPAPGRIDAHQHFWRLARGDYGWLTPDLAAIHRDFMPEDLAPLLAAAGIERTILVQAAPTLAETRFLLDIAAGAGFVAGIVGWVDFERADAPQTIAQLAENPLLVGLRPMIHDLPDPDWMLKPAFDAVFAAMTRHRLVFDALIRPVHLPRLAILAGRYPDLDIVIDHAAKPAIGAGRLDPWRGDIGDLAAHPRVSCKLSGLVTEAGAGWDLARLRPYCDHLVATFGGRRLLFGSDWPVCTLAAGYPEWLAAAEALVAPLDAAARAAIFGGNAARIYLREAGGD